MRRRSLVLVVVGLAACAPRNAERGPAKETHTLRGEVVRLRAAEKIAVIRHEKIEGWMEAMTMEFPVPDPTDFAKLAEGRRVRATVNVNELYFWLSGVEAE